MVQKSKDAEADTDKSARQDKVVETLQARKELRVMLKQVIGAMEQAKDVLDQGTLRFYSRVPLSVSTNRNHDLPY